MWVALLFYRKLQKELKAYKFVVNPEDPCIANKWIPDPKHPQGGRQMTVIWYVDDILVLCEDVFELTKLQYYLGRIYGPGLTIKCGNKHNYLRMNITFCEDRALK